MSREQELEEYRERLRATIVSCQTCQPWEGGPVWVVGKRSDLGEVLDSCGIPEDEVLREEILGGLDCPGCSDNLDAHHEVGVKFDFESAHERAVDRAKEEFGGQLRDFAGFLEKYPMLGADHHVGRLILDEIKSFPRTRRRRLKKSTWYRARRVTDGRELQTTDLGPPPPNAVSSPGRFNHLGQVHWYLAYSDVTAAMEVVKEDEVIVWMQKWVVKGLERVLDRIRLPGPGQEPGHRAAGSAHSGRYMGMRPSRQRYDQDTLRPERDPRDARRIQELEQENTELRKERDRWKQRSEHLQGQLDAARRAGCRQAAPFAKNRPQGRGGRPGRKAGEAYGRQGRRARPAQVDETYAAPVPAACPDCGGAVDVTGVASQYQEELPAVRPVVRRFDIEVGHCSRCQRRVQGRHALQTSDALGAAGAQLGPGVVALVVELHTEMGVPLAKVAHVLRTTFGLQVTPGGLAHLLHRTARDAAPTYTALCEQVRNSPVVTPDETGWRVAAISHWLWAFVTPETTVYAICPGRGFDDATTVLGADFDGVLVRDGWVSYRCYRAALHQSCLNHLLRRCKELQEDHPDSLWAGQVQAVLQTGLAVRDRCNDGELSEHGLASVRGRLVAQLGRLIDAPPPLDDAERFARHLATEFAAVFLFLWDLSIDATNWRAEQAIRPAVVIRKVCGGNRTRHGADSQQVLASVVRTARQRDLDLPPLIATMLRATGPVVPDAFGLPPPPA